jgi:hypothetical protein
LITRISPGTTPPVVAMTADLATRLDAVIARADTA